MLIQQLPTQVSHHIGVLVAAIKPAYVPDCVGGRFPRYWAPQQSNTELFDVDLQSSEIAELVRGLQQEVLQAIKVHRLCLLLLSRLLSSCTDVLPCNGISHTGDVPSMLQSWTLSFVTLTTLCR